MKKDGGRIGQDDLMCFSGCYRGITDLIMSWLTNFERQSLSNITLSNSTHSLETSSPYICDGFSRTLHTSVRSYCVWLCCVRRPNHFHNRQLDMKGHENQKRYQTPAFRTRVSNESQVSHRRTGSGGL